MPRCSVCQHPERHQIEMLKLAGASFDTLVEKFGLRNRDVLWRHMHKHVSAAHRAALVADIPLTELAERAAADGVSLLDHLKIVRASLMSMYLTAVAAGEPRTATLVAGRLLETLRDCIAMNWAEVHDFEDEEVEGALGEIGFRWRRRHELL